MLYRRHIVMHALHIPSQRAGEAAYAAFAQMLQALNQLPAFGADDGEQLRQRAEGKFGLEAVPGAC